MMRLSIRNWPRKWKIIFQIAMSLVWLAFLGIIFRTGWKNREILLPYLIKADYPKLVWIFLFYLSTLVTALIAWIVVIKPISPALSWLKHAQIYYITLAARRLPGTIWYVGGRMLMYQRLGLSKKAIVIASAIETLCLVISGGMIGMIALLLSHNQLPSQTVILVAVGITLALILLSPPVLKRFLRIGGKSPLDSFKYKNIVIALLACGITWVLGAVMITQLILAFYPMPYQDWIVVLGAWTLSGTVGTLFFFFPSNFGVTEITLTALLSTIIPLPLAGVISILARLLTTFFEILLSLSLYPILHHYPLIQTKNMDGLNKEP